MLDAPRTRYADAGTGSVAYQVVGDGPVDLLLAPGFVSHLDLQWAMPPFADFVERLTRFARVILFDKRGTGLSDPSPEACTFDQRMDDIGIILDAVASERAVLLGMSEGGPLSVLYAASHPDRVSSLILYGTFARGATIAAAYMTRFEDAVEHWGEGRTAEVFLSPSSNGAVVRRFTGLFERAGASPALARRLFESIRSADVTDVLPTIGCPTLVLLRRGDPFANLSWSEEIVGLVPDVALVVVDGDDHLPWSGDQEPVLAAIEEFVTGRPAGAVGVARLTTVLFTDIVDSTRLAAEMGDATWTALLRAHNDIVRDSLDEFRGREIKSTGDGFLAVFDGPARGVRCAEAVIDRLAGIGLQVRTGLHSGEIERLDVSDIAGLAVHVAARVGAEAGPGQVLVTSTVRDLTAGTPLVFTSVGTRQLKGVPGTLELFEAHSVPETTTGVGAALDLRALDGIGVGLARRAPRVTRSIARLAMSRSRRG